jgi:RNA polymerase sigma-70 factor, ECF subfamily
VPQEALPWLYAVARNVIGNSRRAAVRREALQERIRSTATADQVADPTDEVDARSDILSAVQLLPEVEREALMLVAWEDLDVRSAASVMGCSPGTFAVRIHRGRRRLQKILSATRFDAEALGNEFDKASGGMS